jgi:hypothetical protein
MGECYGRGALTLDVVSRTLDVDHTSDHTTPSVRPPARTAPRPPPRPKTHHVFVSGVILRLASAILQILLHSTPVAGAPCSAAAHASCVCQQFRPPPAASLCMLASIAAHAFGRSAACRCRRPALPQRGTSRRGLRPSCGSSSGYGGPCRWSRGRGGGASDPSPSEPQPSNTCLSPPLPFRRPSSPVALFLPR